MNSKKIMSAIMAGACALSMTSIAAFAADPTVQVKEAGEKVYEVNAGFTAPVIDVTLPTEIKAVINPYGIEIEVETGINTNTDGIASPEYEIKNNSTTFGIKVGAKLSAKGTGITVVDAPSKIPTKLDSEKTAFAFLNTTTTGAGDYANDEYDATDKTQLAFTEDKPERATIVMTLDKKGGTDSADGWFQIQGKVTDPEIVEKKYAATDKLALNIIFDVNPFNPDGSSSSGGGFTDPASTTGAVTSDVGTLTRTGNNTYTLTGMTSSGSPAQLDLKLKTGYTATRVITTVSGDPCVTANTTGKLTPTGDTGKVTVTYTILDDSGNATGDTLVFTVEITA